MVGSCEHGNEPSCPVLSRKRRGISSVTERLFVSQGRLCSMELVNGWCCGILWTL